jgi:hypothetical protein
VFISIPQDRWEKIFGKKEVTKGAGCAEEGGRDGNKGIDK